RDKYGPDSIAEGQIGHYANARKNKTKEKRPEAAAADFSHWGSQKLILRYQAGGFNYSHYVSTTASGY
ncbi:MAG: hypothetical protein OES99_10670, partial [Gammaproteobacteria bacterium]|nr:hypothetical protein [Gammaproteobacteria bacterium]